MRQKIERMVQDCYWQRDINCAQTTLFCLSELFHVGLDGQIMQAATGLHGAGGYRAQCGLVEGALLFIGIYMAGENHSDSEIADRCYQFADAFTRRFSSLSCAALRPQGFAEDDPPHACQRITVDAIAFAYQFIRS